MPRPILDLLREAVGAAHVSDGRASALYTVDGVAPQAVANPASADEVAAVLALAHERGLAVVPRGGGTAMAYGYPPERLDVVLGTRRMRGLVDHEPADLTATVQAGMTLGEVNRALGRAGQMLPIEAPLADRATIGGIIATNASGPRRLAYGTLRDRLIGLRAVDPRGAQIKGGGRVVKNVAGYDLPKLFVGALGTIGVVTEATFKLAPLPRAQAAVVAGFHTLEQALEAAQALLQAPLRPAALELLNATAFRHIALRSGGPEFSDRLYLVAVDFAGPRPAVERQVGQAHRLLVRRAGKTTVLDDPVPYGAFWRAVIDLGRTSDRPATALSRTSLLLTRLPPLLHGHEAIAESSHIECALHVHLAAGVVRAAWWPEETGREADRLLAEALAALRTAASHLGGHLVVESCPPRLKRLVDVWGPPDGASFAIMRRLKAGFDPDRTLSPGRFLGGL